MLFEDHQQRLVRTGALGPPRDDRRPALLAGIWAAGYATLLVGVLVAGRAEALLGRGRAADLVVTMLVLVCLVLAAAGAGLSRARTLRGGRAALAGLWTVSALLVVVVPTNLVMQVAFAAVTDPLGLVLHALALVGGLLWAAVAVRVQWATGGGCAACGRSRDREDDQGWVRPPAGLSRLTLAAAVVPLVGFTLPHWLWALGFPLGTVETDALSEVRGSLWILGAVPATGAAATVGLVRPWGQVFPARWPLLGGRRVPRWLAVAPALLVATLLVQYGALMTGCAGATLLGVTASCYTADRAYLLQNWAFTGTYPVFLGWGLLLGAAAVGYATLTRARCTRCGRR